jgi:tRNA-2-methylthio-N6-dimethylallyladenosine synthase
MADQIAPEIMDERLQRLQARITDHAHAFNRATIGKTAQILLEREGRRPGQLIGKSPWLQSVVVSGPGLAIGDLVSCDIVAAGPNSLEGSMPVRIAA